MQFCLLAKVGVILFYFFFPNRIVIDRYGHFMGEHSQDCQRVRVNMYRMGFALSFKVLCLIAINSPV